MNSEITRKRMSESQKNSEKRKKTMSSKEYKEKISKANIGRHKYNNGIIEVSTFECPPGFIPGTLKRKNKGNKDMHWYNNGIKQICCLEKDCPPGFVPGMIKKKNNADLQKELNYIRYTNQIAPQRCGSCIQR